MREAGHEFGTTTGRPRRCGWFDAVGLRYASRINGMTGMVITKLDVLTGIDPLRVATKYTGPDGAGFDEFPYHQSIVHKARGDYVDMPGLDGGHHRSAHHGATSRRPPATTWTSSASRAACRSP